MLEHIIAEIQDDLHSKRSEGQRHRTHTTLTLMQARLTGTPVQALPSVMQFPSAFETVGGSTLTVHSCFGSSEHSSMYSVWLDDSGSTPFAVMHQSPNAIWPGTPVPNWANSAVRSFEEPSPASCAMSIDLAAANWGPKAREESTGGQWDI